MLSNGPAGMVELKNSKFSRIEEQLYTNLTYTCLIYMINHLKL